MSRSAFLALTGTLALASIAGATTIAGKVTDGTGAPLADVRVVMREDGASAWSDALGNFTIQTAGPTGIAPRTPVTSRVGVSDGLRLVDGRLRIGFAGSDLLGRREGIEERRRIPSSSAPSTEIAAGRSLAVADTLLFVVNGRVPRRLVVAVEDQVLAPVAIDTTAIRGVPWNRSIPYGLVRDDREGRVYRTVVIGSQVWMAENLDYRMEGRAIDWPFAKVDSGMKYGRQYSWGQAMDLPDSCLTAICSTLVAAPRRGICPVGWHIPTDDEWDTLATFVGGAGLAGNALKSSVGWKKDTLPDTWGFRALPAGRHDPDGTDNYVGSEGRWWTSTLDAKESVHRDIVEGAPYLYWATTARKGSYAYFHSVRCLQDVPSP